MHAATHKIAFFHGRYIFLMFCAFVLRDCRRYSFRDSMQCTCLPTVY